MKLLLLLLNILFFVNVSAQENYINLNIGRNTFSYNSHEYFQLIPSSGGVFKFQIDKVNLSEGNAVDLGVGHQLFEGLFFEIRYSYFFGSEKSIKNVNDNSTSVSFKVNSHLITPTVVYKKSFSEISLILGIGCIFYNSEVKRNHGSVSTYTFTGDWQIGNEIQFGIEYLISSNFGILLTASYHNMHFDSNHFRYVNHIDGGVIEADLKESGTIPNNSQDKIGISEKYILNTLGAKIGVRYYF